MNLILAVVLTAVVLMQGAQIPSYEDQPVIIGKVEAGSPAEKSGILAGDRIVKVAGEDVPTWERFAMVIGTRANRDVPVTVVRGDREQTFSVHPTARGDSRSGVAAARCLSVGLVDRPGRPRRGGGPQERRRDSRDRRTAHGLHARRRRPDLGQPGETD